MSPLLRKSAGGDATAATGEAGLLVRTRRTRVEVGLSFRLHVRAPGKIETGAWNVTNHPMVVAAGDLKPGEILQGEKLASIYTSREETSPLQAARQALAGLAFPAWDRLILDQSPCLGSGMGCLRRANRRR